MGTRILCKHFRNPKVHNCAVKERTFLGIKFMGYCKNPSTCTLRVIPQRPRSKGPRGIEGPTLSLVPEGGTIPIYTEIPELPGENFEF